MRNIPIDEYKDAMRDAICQMCVSFVEDESGSGRCSYENSGQCSLFAHLPDVVDAISRVKSDSIKDYEAVLRQAVCANCNHQDSRGVCNLRDSRAPIPTWCVLDSYFNLIVGTVEDVEKANVV